MIAWWWVIVGLFVGGMIGFFVAAMLAVSDEE